MSQYHGLHLKLDFKVRHHQIVINSFALCSSRSRSISLLTKFCCATVGNRPKSALFDNANHWKLFWSSSDIQKFAQLISFLSSRDQKQGFFSMRFTWHAWYSFPTSPFVHSAHWEQKHSSVVWPSLWLTCTVGPAGRWAAKTAVS